MKKLYGDNGNLSEYGEQITHTVKMAVYKLLNIDEGAKKLEEDDLRTLEIALKQVVSNVVADRIQLKKATANKFAEMKDEQFYAYLKEKYGDNWMLVSLTGEELDRCPHPSDEERAKVWEEAHKAAAEYYNDIPPVRPTTLLIK